MQLGTITVTGSTWTVTSDLDVTTPLIIDYWLPSNAPVTGDRVLFEMVGGQVAVISNVTRPLRVASGAVNVTPTTANVPKSAHVTFPAGLFTVAPSVTVTAATSVPGSTVTGVSANNSATTGFDAFLTRTDTTTTTLYWNAIQD
jgi:hypothetical protein